MADFDFQVLDEKIRVLLRKIPDRLTNVTRRALLGMAVAFRTEFQTKRLSGRPGLNRRTGDLEDSFKFGVSPPGELFKNLFSWVISRSPYARIHEKGGTIYPKRRKHLAVPIPNSDAARGALTAAGRTKGRDIRIAPPGGLLGGAIAGGERSLAAVPDLIFIPGRNLPGGNHLLVRKEGDRIVPQYVLKRSVKIPKRLGFVDTFVSWGSRRQALLPVIRAINGLHAWWQGGGRIG